MLLEEAVSEERDVLGDVLRQELRQGARDAVGLDGERDPVLGSLHEPRVVVDDSEGPLPNEKKRVCCAEETLEWRAGNLVSNWSVRSELK